MISSDPIWVIGHLSPDTDAIASAIGYAWLLSKLNSATYTAGRAGDLNAQTTFAMQKFGLEMPALLSDVRHQRVVLVDHNELSQTVAGMGEAEIVSILDHHRLNGPVTQIPIRVIIEPVGSCSTLVCEQTLHASESLPPSVAGMLLSGILSDTLTFRSPTCTERDRAAALQLAQWAGLAALDDTKEAMFAAIETYGSELLNAGAGLGSRPSSEIVRTDYKVFDVDGLKVGISQVEVTSFIETDLRGEDLKAALVAQVEYEGLEAAILMITDVVKGCSRLLTAGNPRITMGLPYTHLDEHTLDAPGIVSRKQQLLPSVLALLSQGN